jgi:hypothetical protein
MATDFLPVVTSWAVIARMGITTTPKSNVQHQVYALPSSVIVATKVRVCPSAAGAMVAVVATTIQT